MQSNCFILVAGIGHTPSTNCLMFLQLLSSHIRAQTHTILYHVICACRRFSFMTNCFLPPSMALVWLINFLFLCSLNGVHGKKPNIVFILADDHGFNDIGYHNPRIKTPVLDSLAKYGVRLENYYVQPICTPTRSQLLSGRYQIHTGLQHGIVWPSQANALPKNETIIAEKLKENGYATHMIGKWHIGFYRREFIPTQRGFDSFFGYLTGGEYYYTHINSEGYPDKEYVGLQGYDMRRNEDIATDARGNYSTFLFTEQAVKVISAHDVEKPLFLFLAYQAVHGPLQVPHSYTEQYLDIKDKARRTYAGMVSCMDEGIGNVTAALQKRGLWNNTVLIFSTDNGGQIHTGGNNWPLRGWKASLWEGGVRGIGFVHSPLLEKPSRISTEMVHVSDWFPTLVSLAGGSVDGIPLDGYNMWDTISIGKPSPRNEILHNIDPMDTTWNFPYDHYKFCRQAAIRVGDWKLLKGCPGNGSWVPPPEISSSIQFPATYTDNENSTFLFNIREDPQERTELSAQFPEIVSMLLTKLEEYNATSVPVRYPPPDPASKPELFGYVWTPWIE